MKHQAESVKSNYPSLRRAVQWIADEDEQMLIDPNEIQDLITVQLVADLFGKEPIEIATKVSKIRKAEIKKENQK